MAAEPLQAVHLRVHPVACGRADQRHHQRDQRQRHQDDRRRDPVAGEQDGQHDHGHDPGQCDLRQVAREVAVERVDPARGQRRHRAGRVLPAAGGGVRQQRRAQLRLHPRAAAGGRGLAEPRGGGPDEHDRQQRRQRAARAIRARDHLREQPGLRHQRQRGHHPERHGGRHGCPDGPCAPEQPAVEGHATTLRASRQQPHPPKRVMLPHPRRLMLWSRARQPRGAT